MTALRRIAHSPAARAWRLEALAVVALAAGVVTMLAGY